MSIKEDMHYARDLILSGEYEEAREILETIDHPMAYQWLEKLEQRMANERSTGTSAWRSEPPYARQTRLPGIREPRPLGADSEPAGAMTTIALLLMVLVVGAVGAGIMIGLVNWIFYAPIMWVTAASIFGAGTMWLGIGFLKVRDDFMGMVAGILVGLFIWGGFYGGMYLYDRQLFAEEVGSPEFFDTALEMETGQSGIVGYFLYRSTLGVTLRIHRIPINLEGTSLLVLMLLELPVVMGFTSFAARRRAQEPFCKATNRWVKIKKIGEVPGGQAAQEFLDAAMSGDYVTARQMIQDRGFGKRSHLAISVGKCESQGYLRIGTTDMETPLEGTHHVPKDVVDVLRGGV